MISRWLNTFRPGARGDRVQADGRVPDLSSEATDRAFRDRAGQLEPGSSVVEIGTRRTSDEDPTYAHCLFPRVLRQNYLLVDLFPGLDVDEIADLHKLPVAWSDRFDALVAVAVFEHLERPWIAAKEVGRVLAPGGFCFVSTHQTFPLHGHPSDFFRFSREALTLIFEDAGLRVVDVSYRHRVQVIPPDTVIAKRDSPWWNRVWPSYMCVDLLAEKLVGSRAGETP